jgi:hypothetical protein
MVNALLAPAGRQVRRVGRESWRRRCRESAATAADVGVQAGGVGAGDVAAQKAAGEKADVGQALSSAIATLGYAVGQEAIGALAADSSTRIRSSCGRSRVAGQRSATRDEGRAGVGRDRDRRQRSEDDAAGPGRDEESGGAGDGQRSERAGLFPDERIGTSISSPPALRPRKPWPTSRATTARRTTKPSPRVRRSCSRSRLRRARRATDHWEPLPFARTKPDGMSLAEASDYLSSLPKTMEEIAIERRRRERARCPDAARSVSRQSARNVEAQLKEQGVSPSVAKAQVGAIRSRVPDAGRAVGCGSPRAVQSLQPQDQERERAAAKGEAGSSATFRGRSSSSHRSHRQGRECDRA